MKPMNLAEIKEFLELVVHAVKKRIIDPDKLNHYVQLLAKDSHYPISEIYSLAELIGLQYVEEERR